MVVLRRRGESRPVWDSDQHMATAGLKPVEYQSCRRLR